MKYCGIDGRISDLMDNLKLDFTNEIGLSMKNNL